MEISDIEPIRRSSPSLPIDDGEFRRGEIRLTQVSMSRLPVWKGPLQLKSETLVQSLREPVLGQKDPIGLLGLNFDDCIHQLFPPSRFENRCTIKVVLLRNYPWHNAHHHGAIANPYRFPIEMPKDTWLAHSL